MCAKGCAGMSGSKVANREYYCSTWGPTTYNTCLTNCKSASSGQDNRNRCKEGCKFWKRTCDIKINLCRKSKTFVLGGIFCLFLLIYFQFEFLFDHPSSKLPNSHPTFARIWLSELPNGTTHFTFLLSFLTVYVQLYNIAWC